MKKVKNCKKVVGLMLVLVMLISMVFQNSMTAMAASTPAAYPLPALTGNKRVDAANIAKSQVGYTEGSGNLNAYGQELSYNGLEWCAYFAIWCVRKAGGEEYPNTGSTTSNVTWFQNRGQWHNKQSVAWSYNGNGANGAVDSYVPQVGDFVAIENNGKPSDGPEHTAFVVGVDDAWVYTVEGNISNSVVERKYSRSNWKLNGSSSSSVSVNGFGTINYGEPVYNPEGVVDIIAGGEGEIYVKGWTFDRDDLNSNLEVHVYYGGKAGSAPAKAIIANRERTDVNSAYPGVGNYHGFESTFAVPNRGNVEVYVYALNIGSGDNVLLGNKTVTVSEVTPAAKTLPALTGEQREDAVNIAKSQVGYVEGSGDLNIYGKDLGQNGVSWGAQFVLWCLDKAGVEERPTAASTTANVTWFQNAGLWHNKQAVAWSYNGNGCNGVVDSAYKPQIGDVIAVENNGNASDGPENMAIVVAIDNNWIYTVEGNITNSVVERKYGSSNLLLDGTSSSVYINGFGSINYKSVFKPVTAITFDKLSVSWSVGNYASIIATVFPSNASNKTLSWSSTDTSVVTVDSNGRMTAVGPGSARVIATATDGSGVSASCSISITQPVTGVVLNKASLNMQVGENVTLTATVLPANASNKTVTWFSTNHSVAAVDVNGKVTAVASGSAEIGVRIAGYETSCLVTVNPIPTPTPTATPSPTPTVTPTVAPTAIPTPTVAPTATPTVAPTVKPTVAPTATPAPTIPPSSGTNNPVKDFVERMYTVALGRAAEESGCNWWTEELVSGNSDGAGLANGFLRGNEFRNKGYSNSEYIKVLYATFFDRTPEQSEVEYWVNGLNYGSSRESVLAGFVNSREFFNLCADYGISRGVMYENGEVINAGIGKFAERLYTEVLEREGEEDGMEYWATSIANGSCTPEDAAKNFFTSTEYIKKNTTDAAYVKALYRTFMGRECDADGLLYWVDALRTNVSREKVLNDFAVSAEFRRIMELFGL